MMEVKTEEGLVSRTQNISRESEMIKGSEVIK